MRFGMRGEWRDINSGDECSCVGMKKKRRNNGSQRWTEGAAVDSVRQVGRHQWEN